MRWSAVFFLSLVLWGERALGQSSYEIIEVKLPDEPQTRLNISHLNNAGQIAGSLIGANGSDGRIFMARWEPGKMQVSDVRVFEPDDFVVPEGIIGTHLRWGALHDNGEGFAGLYGERVLNPPVAHPETRRLWGRKYFARILRFSGGTFTAVREFESWESTGGILSSSEQMVRILNLVYGGDDGDLRYPTDASGFSWIPQLPHHPEVWNISDPTGPETPLPTGLHVLSRPGDYRYLTRFRFIDDAGVIYGTATFKSHPLTGLGRTSTDRQEVWINGRPKSLAEYTGAAASGFVFSNVNRQGEMSGVVGGLGNRRVALYLPRANYGRAAGLLTLVTPGDVLPHYVSRLNRQGALVWTSGGRSQGNLWVGGTHTPLNSLIPDGAISHHLTGLSTLINDRGWILTQGHHPDPLVPPDIRIYLMRPVLEAEAYLSKNRVSVGETFTFTLRVRNLTSTPRTLGLPIGFRFTGTARFELVGTSTPPGSRVVPAFGSFEVHQQIRATNAGSSTWYSQGRLFSGGESRDTAVAYTESLRVLDRADLLIKRAHEPDSAYGVDDEYQSMPAGPQVRTNSVVAAESSEFQVRVQNDDTQARTFRLKADEGLDPDGWEVTHRLNGVDVSATMRTGEGMVLPELAPGGIHQVTLRVLRTDAPAGGVKRVLYTLEESSEPGEIRDVVEAATEFLGDIVVTSPEADELVPQGRPFTVRFRARPDAEFLDLYRVHTLLPDGPRTVVARNVPAAAGLWVWEVPADLESPSTHLIAVNASNPEQEGTSARFRVRDPWRWHRVTGPPNELRYEKMLLADHAWPFPQTEENVWPESYRYQPAHRYCCGKNSGDDLFVGVGVKYNPGVFTQVVAAVDPSWPAWVRAFGTGATYRSLQPLEFSGVLLNQPHVRAVDEWDAVARNYKGICYGLSLAVMAAFQNPERFDVTWPLGVSSAKLGAISASNVSALDAGHALQVHTFGTKFDASWKSQGVGRPSEVVEALKRLFESDDRSGDRFVWFTGTLPDGVDPEKRRVASHAVVPVGMVQLDPPTRYAIGIYDPNFGGGTTQYLFVDTADESWSHSDSAWNGDRGKGLFLSSLVSEAFENVTPSWPLPETPVPEVRRRGLRNAGTGELVVRIRGRSGAVISNEGELRYEEGSLTETLPSGRIALPITGQPAFPNAFLVPADGLYRIEVLPEADGLAEVCVGTAGRWFRLRQESSVPQARTLMRWDGEGLEVVAGAGGKFDGTARVQTPAGSARGLRVVDLATPNPVGFRLSLEGEGFRLGGASAGSAYDMELLHVDPDGQQVFHRTDIPIPAGAMHRILPPWDALETSPVAIAVDRDGDGQTDDTLTVSNEAPSPMLWPDWEVTVVELEVRIGPSGDPQFRIATPTTGPMAVEVSSDLVQWSAAGDVEAGSWLPVSSVLPPQPSPTGTWFLRARY